MSETDANCPCGSETEYADCCGRFLESGRVPETAEQLMRSRFSAYWLKRIDYIVETTHPNGRTPGFREEVAESVVQVKWTGLQVLSTRHGQAADKIGKVEFTADYEYDGKTQTHHERSRFRRYEGKWKYFDDRG